LRLGVTTRVRLRKTRKTRVRATFNGRLLPGRSVSGFVAAKYTELDGRPWRIEVDHTSQLPTGCGFGTSGAGALSLSLALNDAMDLSLDRPKAAQVAHIAEIVCKTGLGTVSSVFYGGLTLRTVPGAPGVGRVRRIELPRSSRIVAASFGPIPTRKVLGSGSLKGRVNRCAKNLFSKFDRSHPQKSFIKTSRMFSDCLGLKSPRLERLINGLDAMGFESSMAMLGESLFCIASDAETVQIAQRVRREGLTPNISAVARSGAHPL